MSADTRLAARVTLLLLFFCWGTVAVLLRLSVPHFKTAFDLGYRDALLIQSSFFLTYLLVARAAGGVIARIGFRRGVGGGLALMAAGTLALALATQIGAFAALLPAVFVIACGVTFLQVAANPLAASASANRSAAANLTLAQAFNSLGTVAAPMIAAWAFLDRDLPDSVSELQSLRELFFAVGGVLIVLSAISFVTLRTLPDSAASLAEAAIPVEARRRVAAAVTAIFLYVGAEVAITSTLINALEADWSIAADRSLSARLVVLFWLGMLAGRLAGSQLLAHLPRGRTLAASCLIAVLLLIIAAFANGIAAAACLLSLGLFCAIQFPTIFTIATDGLSAPQRARAAGWLCMGIVGGAVVPLLFGEIADRITLQAALAVPVICFVYVGWFALRFGDRPASAAGG